MRKANLPLNEETIKLSKQDTLKAKYAQRFLNDKMKAGHDGILFAIKMLGSPDEVCAVWAIDALTFIMPRRKSFSLNLLDKMYSAFFVDIFRTRTLMEKVHLIYKLQVVFAVLVYPNSVSDFFSAENPDSVLCLPKEHFLGFLKTFSMHVYTKSINNDIIEHMKEDGSQRSILYKLVRYTTIDDMEIMTEIIPRVVCWMDFTEIANSGILGIISDFFQSNMEGLIAFTRVLLPGICGQEGINCLHGLGIHNYIDAISGYLMSHRESFTSVVEVAKGMLTLMVNNPESEMLLPLVTTMFHFPMECMHDKNFIKQIREWISTGRGFNQELYIANLQEFLETPIEGVSKVGGVFLALGLLPIELFKNTEGLTFHESILQSMVLDMDMVADLSKLADQGVEHIEMETKAIFVKWCEEWVATLEDRDKIMGLLWCCKLRTQLDLSSAGSSFWEIITIIQGLGIHPREFPDVVFQLIDYALSMKSVRCEHARFEDIKAAMFFVGTGNPLLEEAAAQGFESMAPEIESMWKGKLDRTFSKDIGKNADEIYNIVRELPNMSSNPWLEKDIFFAILRDLVYDDRMCHSEMELNQLCHERGVPDGVRELLKRVIFRGPRGSYNPIYDTNKKNDSIKAAEAMMNVCLSQMNIIGQYAEMPDDVLVACAGSVVKTLTIWLERGVTYPGQKDAMVRIYEVLRNAVNGFDQDPFLKCFIPYLVHEIDPWVNSIVNSRDVRVWLTFLRCDSDCYSVNPPAMTHILHSILEMVYIMTPDGEGKSSHFIIPRSVGGCMIVEEFIGKQLLKNTLNRCSEVASFLHHRTGFLFISMLDKFSQWRNDGKFTLSTSVFDAAGKWAMLPYNTMYFVDVVRMTWRYAQMMSYAPDEDWLVGPADFYSQACNIVGIQDEPNPAIDPKNVEDRIEREFNDERKKKLRYDYENRFMKSHMDRIAAPDMEHWYNDHHTTGDYRRAEVADYGQLLDDIARAKCHLKDLKEPERSRVMNEQFPWLYELEGQLQQRYIDRECWLADRFRNLKAKVDQETVDALTREEYEQWMYLKRISYETWGALVKIEKKTKEAMMSIMAKEHMADKWRRVYMACIDK